MEKLATIKFRHRYHKLANKEFTTIRGKAQFKRLRVGQEVLCETPIRDCTCPTGVFKAKVAKLELERIRAMGDDFLAADASYPGHPVHGREDFIALVNSFRPKHWGANAQVGMDTEMTIITLQKL